MKRWSFLVVVLGLVSQSAMLAQQDSDSGGVLHIQATTHDSIRESWIIFNIRCNGELAARLGAFEDEGF